jgi:hypothetical protein
MKQLHHLLTSCGTLPEKLDEILTGNQMAPRVVVACGSEKRYLPALLSPWF